MKKILLIVLPVIIILTASCTEQPDVNTLLSNAETKGQIFSKITDNHELMTEFMTTMMSNNHAKMMMQGNKDMMALVMKEDNMMQMMKDNPDMMHNMMSNMMKDGKMMGHMTQMMNQEGLMSDECMQTCMKNMDNKGMMKDGMSMDMKKEKTAQKEDEDHDSQH
jgi:hypothetical protein